MWKEHFKNLLGNSPNLTNKPIAKIINNQLDIKLGKFTQEGLNAVLTIIAEKLDEIIPEIWKTWKFDD